MYSLLNESTKAPWGQFIILQRNFKILNVVKSYLIMSRPNNAIFLLISYYDYDCIWTNK